MLVYFVEDDVNIAYIIEKTLENMQLESQGFSNGESFLDTFSFKKPDLILLDVMLPDISGIEILEKVRAESLEIPVIIVSALYSELDKVKAFNKGADDYITKPFGILELSSRILAKLRKLPNKEKLNFGNTTINLKTREVLIDNNLVTLTNKEYMILKYLMEKPNESLTKETIYYHIWETDYMGSTRSLDMHIKSLREKLTTNSSNLKIETIYGVGFKLGLK